MHIYDWNEVVYLLQLDIYQNLKITINSFTGNVNSLVMIFRF